MARKRKYSCSSLNVFGGVFSFRRRGRVGSGETSDKRRSSRGVCLTTLLRSTTLLFGLLYITTLAMNARFAVLKIAPAPRSVPCGDVSTAESAQRIMIAVPVDVKTLTSVGPTILQTWGADIIRASSSHHVDFRFFVGRAEDALSSELAPYVVELNVRDEMYPPQEKVFEMWRVLHDEFVDYDFYLKADSDSFVNVARLVSFLNDLRKRTSGTMTYTGLAGAGRQHERASLGLKGLYCMGFGYIVGREMLESTNVFINTCKAKTHSSHTDTEIGNCVYLATRMECSNAYSSNFLHMYFSINKQGFTEISRLSKEGRSVTSYDGVFFGSSLTAVIVHPLKRRSDMVALHRQVSKGLRPIIPMLRDRYGSRLLTASSTPREEWNSNKPSFGTYSPKVKQLIRMAQASCVHNPLVQHRSTGEIYRECKICSVGLSRDVAQDFISSIPAFVMNLNRHKEKFHKLVKRFRHTSLRLERYEAFDALQELSVDQEMPFVPDRTRRMTRGEMGYRETMRRLIRHAKTMNFERVLIFDDDVVPHKNFDDKLFRLLNNERCGGAVMAKGTGGTIQLGSTVWGYWPVIDASEQMRASEVLSGVEDSLCFNSFEHVYGSFAVMYHRHTFDAILSWLDRSVYEPFDWIFGHLAQEGYITRAAYPHLIIPDVTGQSDVNNGRDPLQHDVAYRAKIHRWNLSNFDT